jgi:hypothetical protein
MTSTDSTTPDPEAILTAEREARSYAAWLAAHGYHEASVFWFRTTLNNYGPESLRTVYAQGYAVRYAGTLVRDDGSTAEYPTAGITVFCQDSQLPVAKLSQARALVTFSTDVGGRREYGAYTPYYVASYNDRATDLRRDQSVNPGTLPHVILHELTPLDGQPDGPARFYELRMDPAGDLATGTRVRAVSGPFKGLAGTIVRPDFRRPAVDFDAARGRLSMQREVPRTDLEPEAWTFPPAGTSTTRED